MIDKEFFIPVNEFQTPITSELLSQYPDEVQEWFIDAINNIDFIKNLISPNRKRAKDLPRDDDGKIIVDLENPHIIEDADYFRQPALHYIQHGCYTFLKPNGNPQSEYRQFWEEERRRIREGYIRESDGEWVTGFCYWFLNYTPMMVNIIKEGTQTADRVESFPFFFEGIYWRFHYLYKAKLTGTHAIELAKRGAHPYTEKVYTPEGIKNWGDIKIGDKLYGTYGNITTVTDIPFDDIAATYKITLRDGRVVYASDDHIWNVIRANTGKVLHLNTKYLYEHYVSKREQSWRIPSGKAYIYFIPKNNGVDFNSKEVPIDSYTLGLLLGDGSFRNKGFKNQIIFTSHEEDINTYKSKIPYVIDKIGSDKYSYAVRVSNQFLYNEGLWMCKSEDKFIPDLYKYNNREVRLNILRGLLDSDGSVHGNIPTLNTASSKLAKDVIEVARSLGYNANYTIRKAGYKINGEFKQCLDTYEVSIYGGKELFYLERKQVSIDESKITSRTVKTCITNIEYVGKQPCKCVTVDANDSSYLIGDFIQTHNCAKSYSLASIMTHNLFHGESEVAKKRITTVLTAYEKEYLKDEKDGTLAKFIPMMDFVRTNTPFPRLMLKNSPNDMSWIMGYKDNTGATQGSRNTILGVSAKDNPDKLRGKRGWILFEEMGAFRGLLALYDTTRRSVEDGSYAFACMYLVGCVCAGTKVWTFDGRNINIENSQKNDGIIGFAPEDDIEVNNSIIHLHRGVTKEPIISSLEPIEKPCVRIQLYNGNVLECSTDHPIFIQKHRMNHDGSIDYYEEVFKKAGDLKIGDRVIECREISIFGNDALFDARLIGMLIGDGSYGNRNSIKYRSEDKELLDYVKKHYIWKCYHNHITKKGNIYEEGRILKLIQRLREIGIYGQTKINKRLPLNYQTLNRKDTILLLSGLYDTDGSVYLSKKDGFIFLTQSNKEILEQVKILWRKFGVICSITKINPNIKEGRKDKNPWYTLTISGRYSAYKAAEVLELLVPHKQENLKNIINFYDSNLSKKEQKYSKDIIVSKVKSIINIGIKPVYNLTAGLSHTYLANNIVTHNTANEKESSFKSAKTLLYKTGAYRIFTLKNVFDKRNQGQATFGFFFPAYVNRLGCFNKDGVSDVVKALLEIFMARYSAKYGTDPNSVLRVIAEDPITPAEAIIKVKNAYFPTTALTERLGQLDSNPNAFDDVYVGNLILKNGKVEFTITNDTPIRVYQVDNSTKGAVEVFEMPERDKSGRVYSERYIIGHDPVDNDQADSSSLSSTIVLDLWTDRIVAEYTGRQLFADENYEICRLLCLFYNAKCLFESNKKGIYQYFQKMHSTHLLSETPQYLRDRQLIKYEKFGSNAYGVNANVAINNYANSLIRDWLLLPKTVFMNNEHEENVESVIQNLYTIKNRALLEELIAFTPEVNVDRIRALGMVMLLREEKMVLWGGTVKKTNHVVSEWDNDDFFKDNYDNKFESSLYDTYKL